MPDGLLAHLAPLGWQHIDLTGDYLWGTDVGLGPDGSGRSEARSRPGQQSRRVGVFTVRAAKRAILSVLWRDPEWCGWPPGVVRGTARQAAIAASVNHTVRLPRWRRAALYVAQFVTRCRCLGMRWRRVELCLNGKGAALRVSRPNAYGAHRSSAGLHASTPLVLDASGVETLPEALAALRDLG